jgi:hypothetical protein
MGLDGNPAMRLSGQVANHLSFNYLQTPTMLNSAIKAS